MKQSFLFILSLIVELLLLLLIFLFLFLGVVGVFLPIIPGLILVAFAASIYSLMIKNNFGTITPKLHQRLLISKNKIRCAIKKGKIKAAEHVARKILFQKLFQKNWKIEKKNGQKKNWIFFIFFFQK